MKKTSNDGLIVGPRGTVAEKITWSLSFWTRLRGLLGRRPLQAGEAMVIRPCRRVHTFGIGYPLDVVFCDEALSVLHVQALAPRRLSRRVGKAALCLELPAGRAQVCGIEPGVRLAFEARP